MQGWKIGCVKALLLGLLVCQSTLANVVISEFSATGSELQDEDGDASDWIEVYNSGNVAVDLNGWALTDDATVLNKWIFPSVSVPAGGYLVVFASGKNRVGAQLHTNFSLKKSGEYLALVKPDGVTRATEFAPSYPAQVEGLSYGLDLSAYALVDETTPLKFLTGSSAPAGWENRVFDDQAWAGGLSSETGVLITEVHTGGTDAIELQNLSSGAVNTTGWKLLLSNGGAGISDTLNFVIALPASVGAGQVLSYTENQGGVGSIPWPDNASRGWVILLNGEDEVVDCVFWGSYSQADIQGLSINVTIGGNTFSLDGSELVWVGGARGGGSSSSNKLVRQGDRDLDRATDFNFQSGGSFGVQNPTLSVPFSSFGINDARAGIGYDNNGEYDVDLRTLVKGGTENIYMRFAFEVTNPADLSSLTLKTRYDDGFAAFLNGVPIDSDNFDLSGPKEANAVRTVNIVSHLGALVVGQNILAFHLKNYNATSSDLFLLPELLTTQTQGNGYLYMDSPSPGNVNSGTGFQGILSDTEFSVGRGFYTSSFQESITCDDPGTSIVYTLDGSEPSLDNGTRVNAASASEKPVATLTISDTTILRAAAFKNGHKPTNIDTQTYIFVDHVVNQPSSPSGWPAGPINGQVLDYEMSSPSSVNTTAQDIRDALQAVPSISVVTDQENLLNSSSGIYVNANNRGSSWERPVSLEMIYPTGLQDEDGNTVGFQIDAGIRIRGGFSRGNWNPKHSFRIFFRSKYGDSKLRFPLFGSHGSAEYDIIDLRTPQNYSWIGGDSKNTFLREVFARDTQRDMGQHYTRSRYYHLYVNGLYWGLYMTDERPKANYGDKYLEGKTEDFDAVKSSGNTDSYKTEVSDGNFTDWSAMYNLAKAVHNDSASATAKYFEIQGLNSSGVRDMSLPVHLDLDNVIDYMLVIFYTGSFDAPLSTFVQASNNWFAVRNRERDDRGWVFFAHDTEHSMGTDTNKSNDRTGPFWFGDESISRSNPQYIHQYLSKNNEYRLLFADRVYRHFFNQGVFTNSQVLERIANREATVSSVIDAHAARWGDTGSSLAKNKSTWEGAVVSLKNWTNNRHLIVLAQLRNDDLYPVTQAPVFSQHGGYTPVGTQVGLTNPNTSGTIYYTIDGNDPRVPGGGVHSSALSAASVTMNASVVLKARVLSPSGEWSALNEARFSIGNAPLATSLVISKVHYNPADPSASEIAAGHDDADDFEFLEIMNISNDTVDLTALRLINHPVEGGVAFDFSQISSSGNRVLMAGERAVVVRNESAFSFRYGGSIKVLGSYSGKLSNGGEMISLETESGGQIKQFVYDDQLPWPTCSDGAGYSMVLIRPLQNPDHTDPQNWRCSVQTHGSPGVSDVLPAFTSNPTADDDHDGLNALLEHALGTDDTNPNDGGSSYSYSVVEVTAGDGMVKEHLAIQFKRNLGADDIEFSVEASSDLATWQTGVNHVVLVNQTHHGDGTVTEVWRLVQPLTLGQSRFLRLKVTLLSTTE